MALGKHPPAVITQLLASIRGGDDEARRKLFDLVQRDLKKIAAVHMNGERPGHVLQPTALVNELYMRLFGKGPLNAQDREHFYKLVSRVMRQVLLDYARRGNAGKRAHGEQITMEEGLLIADASPEDQIAVHEAIDALAQRDKRQADILELRWLVGQSAREIAEHYGVDERTIQREVKTGMLFIRRHLESR